MYYEDKLSKAMEKRGKSANLASRVDDTDRLFKRTKSSNNIYMGMDRPLLLQDKQRHFELSIDGVSIILNGTLSQAQEKLTELSFHVNSSKRSTFI